MHLPKTSIAIAGIVLLLFSSPVAAQTSFSEGVAVDVEIAAKDVPDGSIVSMTAGKYMLSEIPYDPNVYGIVTYNPSVHFEDISPVKKWATVSFGKAKVRVSAANGNIKIGDYITTSSVPGVGQKATENGFVVGVAMENYANSNPREVGTMYVNLHLNFGMLVTSVRENLIASLRRGATSPFLSPANALRYLAAGTIAILSFIGGFWFFGRVSSRGIEAIGRNPLARKFILLSVFLNVMLTLAVMMLGVFIAYLVLVI